MAVVLCSRDPDARLTLYEVVLAPFGLAELCVRLRCAAIQPYAFVSSVPQVKDQPPLLAIRPCSLPASGNEKFSQRALVQQVVCILPTGRRHTHRAAYLL